MKQDFEINFQEYFEVDCWTYPYKQNITKLSGKGSYFYNAQMFLFSLFKCF